MSRVKFTRLGRIHLHALLTFTEALNREQSFRTVPNFFEPFLAMLDPRPFRDSLQRGHLLVPQRFPDVRHLVR